MIIELLDYEGNRTQHDIGELDDVAIIMISILSGDEVATVTYRDYSSRTFDSRNDRLHDYFDGSYELYDFRKEKNLLDSCEWKNRKSSYDSENWPD